MSEFVIEVWRDVEGFPGYRVSSFGQVATLWVKKGHGLGKGITREIGVIPRVMKQILTWRYWSVNLYRDGKVYSRRVHHLVLEAFAGPRPFPEALGLHKDDDQSNNRIENLYWGDHAQNMRDKVRNGKNIGQGKGEAHSLAKLKDEDVLNIRKRLMDGETQEAIARDFGVTRTTIKVIKQGRTWGHLGHPEGEYPDGRRKLTDEDKALILQRVKAGESYPSIARDFGVTEGCIRKGCGHLPREKNCRYAKLTDKDVLEIRRRLMNGENMLVIAANYGVGKGAIMGIRLGKTHQHLPDPNIGKYPDGRRTK